MSLSTDQQMMRFCCEWFFFYANASMPLRFGIDSPPLPRIPHVFDVARSCDGLSETTPPHLDPIGSDDPPDMGNNLPPSAASANTPTVPPNIDTTVDVINANININVHANADAHANVNDNSNINAKVNINHYQCPLCSTTCVRDGDLSRHMKKHLPPQYDCLVNGCERHGHKAFYRKDKLLDHQRKKHGMPV